MKNLFANLFSIDILYEIELVPILNTFKWVCEKSNSGSTTFLWTIEDKKKDENDETIH